MVIDSGPAIETDRLFHALADATRRNIVRRVIRQEQSVSALARHYPMSVTAVQKHVAVLEGAGLVTRRRQGREQRVTARHEGLSRVRELLDSYEELWRGRLDRMSDVLADDPDEGSGDGQRTRASRPHGSKGSPQT